MLASDLVRHGEHCGFFKILVLKQTGLHLSGRDFFAAAVDHIFYAVNDGDKAFIVQNAYVAGTEPAVMNRIGRGLFIPPITLHQGDALEPDFARFAIGQRCAIQVCNAHINNGREHPSAARMRLKHTAGAACADAVGFGQTKANARHSTAELAQHLIDQAWMQGSAAKAHAR